MDQLNRILDVLGTPDETVFNRICSEKVIYLVKGFLRLTPNRRKHMFGHCPFESPSPLARFFLKQTLKVYVSVVPFICHSTLAVLDLLSKMITWDPDQRLTVIEALEHPWLANYRASPSFTAICPLF